MQRLRVGMIIQAYAVVGGAEQQLANLAPALERVGVDVHIVTRRTPGAPRELAIPGATLHAVGGEGGSKVKASLTYTGAALPLLRKLRPHALHTHDLYSPTTIACLAKPITGAGIVAKSNCGGEFGNVARMRAKRGGPQRLAWFRRTVDAFAVISDEIDQELADIGVAPDRRVRIPNGVDVARFSPGGLDRAALRGALGQGDAPLVVYTGRFNRQKGTDVLLKAWRQVAVQRPDARLLLVGTPRDPDVPSWDTDQPGVVVMGPRPDVAPILRGADVFVNASRAEGLSNSLLEALSVGMPVVATDIGGNREIVHHERSGLLVPADDEHALAAGILRALTDETATSWGAAARTEMVASYSLDSVAERLAELYERVGRHR
jgi:glycosyltransferase involved in cell wall biosynthesis